MATHAAEAVGKLRELIKDIKCAMLTTVMPDGELRSRPMATQQAEFDGDLWFFTAASSHKAHEIEREHHVNVSFADPDSNRYVSVSGRAMLLRDRRKAEELWNPLYKAWFPQGLDDSDLALLKVEVDQAEYWDTPSRKMVQLAGFVKAAVTGQPYQPGENEKVGIRTPPPA